MTSSGPLRKTWDDADVLHLALDAPPGNVLDAAMVTALRAAIAEAKSRPTRAVLFEGAGKHFSFGASVEEHLPGKVKGMLRGFHGLFRDLIDLQRPLIAAVRGQCLGGGLELAAFCHRVFAHPDSVLGQPEIRLAVLAPAASVVLPRRVGQAAADDLLLSGRTIGGSQALALGLVDEVADDPTAAAQRYAAEAFGATSIPALGFAVGAARSEFNAAFLGAIVRLETLYLDDLMSLKDPEEGLRAFLEKRRPVWADH